MCTIEKGFEDLKVVLKDKKKKPILFVGSGLSKRYLDSPSWEGLLTYIAEDINGNYEEIKEVCNNEYERIAQELEYYSFRNAKDDEIKQHTRREIFREKIARIFEEYCNDFTRKYRENEEQFSIENENFNKDINTKLMNIQNAKCTQHQYAQTYKELAEDLSRHSEKYRKIIEIQELQKITPKAIITTNYDTLLEDIIFVDKLDRHIGQENFIDNLDEQRDRVDLYKIHGCVTKPDSIIITKEDYDDFFQKSKYLYSKLLTMFWEYPLIFIGYSISDRNIKDILTVMIEVMTEEQKQEFLKYIWVIDYVDNEEKQEVVSKEVELLNGKSIKVTCFRLKYYDIFLKTINEVVLSQNFGDLKFAISDNVIELLIKPLYQQQNKLEVVIRELLQNALDACKKKGIRAEIEINIFEEDGRKYLEIKDNGIGMGLREIRENFLTVGKTDKKNNQQGLVGKYGIGVLSIFLIGDYAEVYTKKVDSTLLALKLYINDEKKQVSWLGTVDGYDEKDINKNSFTILKISLNEEINITSGKSIEEYLKILGLENYMVKGENSIIVNCMGEQSEIIKMNKEEWFLDLENGMKLYNSNCFSEENVQESDKKIKSILDKKNIVFFNDMISTAVYEKEKYRQLNDISMPFVIFNIKNVSEAETEFKTELSRSSVHISGEMMRNIARGIYKLEIEKMVDIVVKEKERLQRQEIDTFDLVKQIADNCMIIKQNVDILIEKNGLFFSRSNFRNIVRVWGNESSIKEWMKDLNEPLLYRNFNMHKSSVGDMIINNHIIGISIKYLDEYIYKATCSYNGLKKEALVKILKKIGIENIYNSDSSAEIWEKVNANKDEIRKKYNYVAQNGMIWFDNSYNISSTVDKSYVIVFKSYMIEKYLDDDFYEILKTEVEEKQVDNIIKFLN